VLPEDDLNALDAAIYRKGVAIDRERLFTLGRERFAELLRKDSVARAMQRVIGTRVDLTSWPSVEFAFATVNGLTTPVPRRKLSEQASGMGLEREAAATISDFTDLWKVNQNQEIVRSIYSFYDAFASLCFGQSMLEQLQSDGRIRSRSFCGSKLAMIANFKQWFSVLDGPHFLIGLPDALFHLVAWVADEPTPLPDTTDLARDWHSVRSPSLAQVRLVQAIINGFVSGHREWTLWDYVGRRTRTATDLNILEVRRKELARRFPAVQAFHDYLRAAFYKEVTSRGEGAYRQFDGPGYRSYIERNVQRLSNRLSGIVALASEQLFPRKLVARFTDWLLCEGAKPKSVPTAEKLERQLAKAFPGSRFRVIIEDVCQSD
jgi:hypothetical protein